ncbi:MAG TPA: hypothetical protein VKQ54_13105 [Caulobacteraceae bacterium]|nr:hypothetical protein [Caulobacteraceae bacterium]
MTEIADPAAIRERTMKSLTVPLGLANPLWLAFGAAASAGAAWWLMTRWARPLNAEAMFGAAFRTAPKPAPEKAAPEKKALKAVETTPAVLEAAPVAAPAIVEAVAAPVEAVLEAVRVETAAIADAVTDALAETEAQFETKAEAAADDLTRLVGVGPRTAAALAERGVTRFADLAAWTEAQMAAFDAELSLKGRSVRDAWRAQAKRLAAES